MNPPKTYDQLAAENEQLRIQLEEANETIQAIRTGQIDALVVEGNQGHEIYTLKTADQTYRVFIETMHEGAVTLNEQGLILYSNSTFADMVSQPLSSVIGTALTSYIHPADQPTYEQFFRQSWQAPEKAEITLHRADSNTICLFSGTPLRLDEGNCLSLILTDLTLQKQTQDLLKSSNERLADLNAVLGLTNQALNRSNASLQQFAYVASHDLQEPLRKVQQFGDILKTRYQKELGEGVAYLERMQTAASRMSSLIRDLLSYSRIATERDMRTPVSLNQVIDSVLADLELIIAETGAQVTVEPLPVISGNTVQLGQLFQNLMSNALKFRRTDQNGALVLPQIQVRTQTVVHANLPPSVKPARRSDRYYCIEVADNGIGFDEKYLDRIFQVFQRLHGKDQYVGTGIGLAICEKVVANHDGAITAKSQVGQGATFLVYLPV